MDLFGVQELPNSKSISAPGYAIVPDLGPQSATTAASRKRGARKELSSTAGERSATSDAKILRELAALDKESARDVVIPVPIRARDGAGRVSHGKVTPAVRKILQSQKTFSNHLSDAEALAAANPSASVPLPLIVAPSTPAGASAAPAPAPPAKRSHKKKDPNAPAATPLRKVQTPSGVTVPDVVIAEIPKLDSAEPNFKPHAGDEDSLLKSRVPPMPTQAEIEALIRAPPLSYLEARARLEDSESTGPTPPPRKFCALCGYWGRVKCKSCGVRVCALECLRTHQEECYTRYGA